MSGRSKALRGLATDELFGLLVFERLGLAIESQLLAHAAVRLKQQKPVFPQVVRSNHLRVMHTDSIPAVSQADLSGLQC